MASIFHKHNVSYAVDKIGDFLRGSGSGVLAGWPETSAKIIVEALEELSTEMRGVGMTPEATVLPIGLYAARELQKYLRPERGDIQNRNAAHVYYRCLRSVVRELQQLEQRLAERQGMRAS